MTSKKLSNAEKNLILSQDLKEKVMEERLKLVEDEINEASTHLDPKDIPEDFEQLDPKLYRILKKYTYEEPSENLREKALELLHIHKKRLQIEGKLNDDLNLSKPIITPIKDLKRWFILDGFTITNLNSFRIVAALIVVFVGSALFYVIYFKNTLTVDMSSEITNKNTPIPNVEKTPLGFPTPTDLPNSDVASAPKDFKQNITKEEPKVEQINKEERKLVLNKKQKNKIEKLEKKRETDYFSTETTKTETEETVAQTDFPLFSNPKILEKDLGETLVRSLTIENINSLYLGDLPSDAWSSELKKELEVELGKYWTIKDNPKESQAAFKVNERQGLVLLTKFNQVIWQKKDFIIGKGFPNVIGKEIVSELIKLIDSKNKSDK